jgi:alkanesulfonate monooxygenase SsuD/methylene tetrahydromethanopterin reductase-like flavin-dependent oxidoreductase (luciferase family)
MHLAQFLMYGPTYHSLATWRHPRTDRSFDWTRPELYQHIARVCERGKFDMVFFADFNIIFEFFQRSLAPALRHGQSVVLPQIVGTPQQVADQLEAFQEQSGGDGFMVSAAYTPGAIEDFVDGVVPILQSRGLFGKQYAGDTLQEHLK